MFWKISALFLITVFGIAIWGSLPRVPNPHLNPHLNVETSLQKADVDPQMISDVWSGPGSEARERARIILQGETVIFQDGPVSKIMNTASMRKPILSLLYGIAIEKGMIDPDKTLAELGIDEVTPLTAREKTATIRDLLMFRSGIFLPAAGEHDHQITDRPKRGSHPPGTYFFSNNFDANALGKIFIQETGHGIGDFMERYLANPLGMQDFTAANVIMGNPWFWPGQKTLNQQYYIYMSARDVARIGAMVAQDGRWNGTQVVPSSWIKLSSTPHSDLSKSPINYGIYDAFGYQWWLDTNQGTMRADGYGGHLLLINREHGVTVVERNFSGNSYISIGLWLMKDRDDRLSNSFAGAQKAYTLMIDGTR